MNHAAIEFEQLPYRLGVGILLLNAEGQVFTAKRIDMTSEAWQMPQGGIDEGEDPYQCALRELREETSVTSVELLAESPDWLTYDLPASLVPLLWKGQYRGQKQKWYALRFTGEESEINLQTEHPEFSEYRWAELRELPDVIVPFKRELYQRIVDLFGNLVEA